jgi:hypothetical protein
MSFFYAQINDDQICFAITQTAGLITQADMIPVASYDTSLLGKIRTNGEWLDPPPIPPGPSYTAFWDALIASSVYASIRTQSMTSLPMNTLATEFIALIGDAKAGRPNEAAIQASMSAVFSTGTFTTADAAEFTAALAAGLLDDIYTLS